MPLPAAQCLDVGEDVVAGHFPQVVVAVRPLQQRRSGLVEVEPDRALSAGSKSHNGRPNQDLI